MRAVLYMAATRYGAPVAGGNPRRLGPGERNDRIPAAAVPGSRLGGTGGCRYDGEEVGNERSPGDAGRLDARIGSRWSVRPRRRLSLMQCVSTTMPRGQTEAVSEHDEGSFTADTGERGQRR